MKKFLFSFCAAFSLCAVAVNPAHADLTPEQVRKIYASSVFEARDTYNNSRPMRFAESSAINGFFSTLFAEKVNKVSSFKMTFQPTMKGWTALVFQAIYSRDSGQTLPAKLTAPYKILAANAVSAIHELRFDTAYPVNTVAAGFMSALFLFAISILPIHKIKFRLFIQRE
ncbi:MAG: hypothetical protein CVU78_06305 [Elusimicrobia bacterium HGW-Elusimicrobia-2]|nr:MAG: hypothetical protein CVU78_06305 [Elusimicrobia bacterium HGW-Elusimicrobia-2]